MLGNNLDVLGKDGAVPRAGLNADVLVSAAAELADEAGWEAVTLSALARRFGVADASLYAHVRNREDLRNRVAVRAAAEFADALGLAVAGRSGEDALAAFAGAYRAFAVEYPGRYAATQIQLPREVGTESAGHWKLIGISYAVLREYDLPEPAATDAVRLLRSTFHGFAALEASGGFGHPRDIGESWRIAIRALHQALIHWPGERT
jgi:AcrR family transcriptional regulator